MKKCNVLDQLLERAVNKILSYAELPKDWDGYGGRRFTKKFLRHVNDVVRQVIDNFGPHLLDVIPGPCGSGEVGIDFCGETRRIILVVAPRTSQVKLLCLEGDKPIFEGDVPLDKLNERIGESPCSL